jgi:hypothetical protein
MPTEKVEQQDRIMQVNPAKRGPVPNHQNAPESQNMATAKFKNIQR